MTREERKEIARQRKTDKEMVKATRHAVYCVMANEFREERFRFFQNLMQEYYRDGDRRMSKGGIDPVKVHSEFRDEVDKAIRKVVRKVAKVKV